ncbi:SDR family NAD(P)-dependent oxidoreductase [Ornithinimicrobium sp. INDO-MA30-4]|nr:SDR family NAD(P)-dependent oxidoreductase [Ornithinimicrobium sp. INDO-MA30-4]UJH70946.1 SDR family NAD(P)-dependent oxidoreductase [Ornithinimicrobium sp. INDO-MA30-4]
MAFLSKNKHSFTDQTVLITGGGSGIGRLLALGASARGARIIVWDLDGQAAESVCGEIKSLGGSADALLLMFRTGTR